MVHITSLGSKAFEGISVAADWIQDLKSSNSRKYKERVIERALIASRLGSSSAQSFLYNCYLAYNPFYVYNIKKVPETAGLCDNENPWIEFWGLIEELRTGGQGKQRKYGSVANHLSDKIKKMSLRFDSDEWNCVARPVLLKDMRCGVSVKTLNKVLGNTEWKIPAFECQLAQDSENHPRQLSGKKWLEPKLDGIRALAAVTNSSVTIFSRTGKTLDNFNNIEESIADNRDIFSQSPRTSIDHFRFGNRFVIDGEIVSTSFQHLMAGANKKGDIPVEDAVFYIFDIIPLDDFIAGKCEIQQYYRREVIAKMNELLHDRTSNIRGLNGIEVDLSTSEGHNIMHRYARTATDNNFEGILIKDLNAYYTSGYGNAWLKWKPTLTVDLKVVSVQRGTGRNINRMGSLLCEGVDAGRQIWVNVGSGFSDDFRDEAWADQNSVVGKIVEIKCDSVSKNQNGTYSLRFPRFLRFRGFDVDEKL